ncbi:SDR family NAD(P)-dependent oxidoreductase [Candidatus Uabimicrobium amorphum]|uniref:Alcohol dehydrogenase n=1 Tax=Uabimicrobium amorphum TaxID=2596890 RepID=A0A5S9IQW2_UABAM|nr:SDR family NAD(P)-dependent oxidoreductase [Candidatus Uabimicrobium amorphum]BBM85976.1 alcohol dehydrogenase [Candidatus Uabimicrobium amorphum]
MSRVLITGVSAGLGRSLAELYMKKAQVYGVSRRRPGLPQIIHQCIDLADLETVAAKLGMLVKNIDALDVVILNAAHMGVVEDLKDTSVDLLREVMAVNVWSNKIICDTLFQQGIHVAQIIAISSGMAENTCRGGNGYALSKLALNRMMAMYALEQQQTHFCTISPGIIDTAMQEYLQEHKGHEKFPILAQLQQAKDQGMMQSPDHVAQRIVGCQSQFLHYPSGSFVSLKEVEECY